MAVSCGSARSAATTFGNHSRRAVRSPLCREYRYCEEVWSRPPPPSCRSWSAIRNSRPPGTLGISLRRRSITFCASILRSLIGFRRTSTMALLVPLLPPMKPATLCTAGSASKARR
ncbi:hypothetical protein D3C77_470240 [compost metagenome]